MTDVGRHPKIELLAYSEVKKVTGYVGNFKVTVHRKARFVDEKECTACGDRNYRTQVNTLGGAPKMELNKFCKRERKRTVHKLRRK